MKLTDAFEVVRQVEQYTGGDDEEFPTDQKILLALVTLRDALSNVADATKTEAAKDIPQDLRPIAMRQRELPTDLQAAINAQLKECGNVFKPFLRTPADAHAAFNGLLEAFVTIAEIGATGRRAPQILLPNQRH